MKSALAALAFVAAGIALAHAQTVTAELLSDSVRVGEPVEFVITARGENQARLLDSIQVDGLRVLGKSDQFQMQMSFPGGMEVTTRQALTLVAEREGEFTIPALRVRIDNKEIMTRPTVLKVSPGVGGIPVRPAIPLPQSGQPQPPPATSEARAFGEIVMAADQAFVGEVVPVDLRFYVDARLPAQFSERPSFNGEGLHGAAFGPSDGGHAGDRRGSLCDRVVSHGDYGGPSRASSRSRLLRSMRASRSRSLRPAGWTISSADSSASSASPKRAMSRSAPRRPPSM